MDGSKLSAEDILASHGEPVGVAGGKRGDGLQVGLLVEAVAHVLLGGEEDELGVLRQSVNLHDFALLVGATEVEGLALVITDTGDEGVLCLVPVGVHIDEVGAHVDLRCLAAEGLGTATPHLQQLVADVEGGHHTGGIHVAEGDADGRCGGGDFLPGDGSPTVEGILDVGVGAAGNLGGVILGGEQHVQQILGGELEYVGDKPNLEGMATVVETATNLGDEGAAIALGLVGFLNLDGIHLQRSGNDLAGGGAADEDAVVHGGDGAAFNTTEGDAVGNTGDAVGMTENFAGIEHVDGGEQVLVEFDGSDDTLDVDGGGQVHACGTGEGRLKRVLWSVGIGGIHDGFNKMDYFLYC